ncbi:hypothetical protein ACOMHN_032223 [Nucella lapillus]
MLMMRAKVQGHRWVDHPAAAVMEARVPGQWVDRPAAMVMEAREQGRCWIDHPAAAVMEARVQGRHWVDRPSGAGTGRTAGVVEAQSTRRSVSALTQVWPVGTSDRRRVWRGPWCAWASAIRRGSPSHFSTSDQTGWWRLINTALKTVSTVGRLWDTEDRVRRNLASTRRRGAGREFLCGSRRRGLLIA